MTTPETCTLLADAICEISATRRERDVWRLIAQQAIHHAAELTRENEMINRRRYTCRRRMAKQRDDAQRQQEAAA